MAGRESIKEPGEGSIRRLRRLTWGNSPCETGLSGPYDMDHAQPCAPWWRVGGQAVGQRYESGDSVLVSRLRHKVLLQQAAEALHISLAAIDDTQSAECVALELRVALNALGEIVGTATNEDILDLIFRDFCIGK